MSTYTDASLIYYPSGVKAGKAYSLKPTDGTGDLTFTRASTATRVNESGLIESVATGVPRIDFTSGCGKLLLEPQRANGIRNSTIVGAVAGTPGTLPTNWSISGTAGLTQTIVAIGTENGLNYIDFRLNGTTTSTTIQLRQELSNIISAATGQTWSQSSYFKLVAGTLPLATRFLVTERNIANGFVTESVSPTFTISSSLIRYQYQQLLNGGSTTAFVQPALQFTFANATAYDFTIRIAAPQMELGSYATSYIPTTTTAVTRVADVATKTGISALIGQTEGTIFLDTKYLANASASARWFKVFGVSDEIGLSFYNLNNVKVYINGTNDVINTSPLSSNGVKIAFAYNATGVVLFINGVQYSLPNGGSQIMSSLDSVLFDAGVAAFQQANVNSFMTFPTRKSNTELAELTTI